MHLFSGFVACFLPWIAADRAVSEQLDDNIFVPQPPPGEEFAGKPSLDPEWKVGPWIWDEETHDKQHVNLWRAFEIPDEARVVDAKIRLSVDNGYRLMLNGRELGTGSDWRSVTEYDVGLLLRPGRHVLAVEAFNDNREAGMAFGMIIELGDGRVMEIPSDTTWRVVPQGEGGWENRAQPQAHWHHAVLESEFLPRGEQYHLRVPTMVVKVPPIQPLETTFWRHRWVQALLWGMVLVGGVLYLRARAKLALQSRARALLDEERARIARDIHDELGARLTEMALQGEVAQMELPDASPVRPHLEALCEKARATSGAMDELVWVVNSRRDTVVDFATYACKHAQRFLEATPIRCRLNVEADLPDVALELPVRRSLLLAVKEALHNAARHSGAGEVHLRIHARGQMLVVRVEDDGSGFALDSRDATRNGLKNMEERMREIGGRCTVKTAPGRGCEVEFQVPILRGGPAKPSHSTRRNLNPR